MAATDLWQTLDGPGHVEPSAFEAWRVVEGQHVVSTRKLVDDVEEQEILEELIDRTKTAPPRAAADLHYLLFTPFRYPPLRHGSRFGTRAERGIWYGSLDRRTAFAERAYYKILFLEGCAVDLSPVFTHESAFRAAVETDRFVDLAAPPFSAHEAAISSATTYAYSQPLGRAMRGASVAAATFVSARDRARGLNVALFEPAFGRSLPTPPETWTCTASRVVVELRNAFLGEMHVFPRDDFEVDGRLPAPALTA